MCSTSCNFILCFERLGQSWSYVPILIGRLHHFVQLVTWEKSKEF